VAKTVRAARRGGSRPSPVRDRVLAALTHEPQRAVDIAARLGLLHTAVRDVLKVLKKKDQVLLHGRGLSATWSLPAGVLPSTKRTATPPPAKNPRPLNEKRRDFLAAAEQSQNVLKALEFNRDTARDALDLYVASTVDPAIYAGLKGAMEAAQTALDAFVAGGRS
jgi:hypothetical protein